MVRIVTIMGLIVTRKVRCVIMMTRIFRFDTRIVRLVTKIVTRIVRISNLMVRKETGLASVVMVIIIVRMGRIVPGCDIFLGFLCTATGSALFPGNYTE